MLESKETGNIYLLDSNNTLSFWEPINRDSLLKEILTSFFKNGAEYKDKVLISRFFSTSEAVTHTGESISVIGARDGDEDREFYVYIKINSQELDTHFVINWKLANGDVAFHVDFTDPPTLTDEGYITIGTSNWNATTKEFTFTFTLTNPLTAGLDLEAIENNGDYWLVEQYEVTSNEGQITSVDHDTLPILDCSDFASFIYAASKGKIIKNKIFDCKNLVNENYDFVEEVEKISNNGSFIKYNNLSEVFQQTENGDIYIFQDLNGYHCITIIDIRNKLYTEISGTIQYYLGKEYNCRLSPYNLENRVKELMSDTTFYKVRLV